jgi:hypothetical protein
MTLNRVTEAVAALSALHAPSLDDAGLIDTQRQLGELRRRIDAASATIAAEVAHRSRPELGYDGLAQRLGARTPQLLVQQTTGLSKREASVLVRIGSLLSEHAPEENATPWLTDVLAAVGTGDLSVESAEVIRVSMGSPDDNVTAAELSAAAAQLVHEASSLTLERLAARGRELRADLDLAGVLGREQALRDRRYLHVIPQSDGMTRISGLLDPESAAIIVASLDAATSPRRGGPRFVDPDAKARGEEVVADARSTEQLALDSFVELVRIGTLADPGTVLGARQPAVQVLVTLRDLDARLGIGRIEGQDAALSIESVDRNVCAVGTVPILFDTDGYVVNVGRNQRLFTFRQRMALAARDGGCIFPRCDRPPSWTEAHHINEFRNGGRTDLADGVLLCRHHHLLVHNNGWRVIRRGSSYFVVPPPGGPGSHEPIPAPSKSATARRLMGVQG